MAHRPSRVVTVLVLFGHASILAPPAHAHNEPIHQAMTDYAYEVLLAGALYSSGTLPRGAADVEDRLRRLAIANPAMNGFYADMAKALPELRKLKSGLVGELNLLGQPKECSPFGPFQGQPADWQLPPGQTLEETEMGSLRFPVKVTFGRGAAFCGIDEEWKPSGALATVNVAPMNGHRDHTGVTLGYHSAGPDFRLHDWRMRSTTLETLQDPFVAGSIGAGVSALVFALCAIACGIMPILCPACPAIAAGAGGIVIDEIMSLDAAEFEHSDFVGMGHHVDVKPSPPFTSLFDDRRGKFAPEAGPSGSPDTLELMTFVLFDLLGWHVNFDASDGAKNYEIILFPGGSGGIGGDEHRNSINRGAADWEPETAIHNQFTPVDNMARFGWQGFVNKSDTSEAAEQLGFSLHALGDASSPMHTVGTAGHGHRPYEDSVDMKYHELVGSESQPQSLATISVVLARAFVWRQAILAWRAQTGHAKDVPLRDLVTQLAMLTRQKAEASPAVWNSAASLEYFFGSESAAKAVYETSAMTALQRDTVVEAIALKLAFLVSTAEVTL
jgi:hypothetical protein